jgi:pSer/pThr/pTyr-binding forkhead associated (FHA) protein
MCLKIEIHEPGLSVGTIAIASRINDDSVITIGRPFYGSNSSHISIRTAPKLISRQHLSMRLNDDESIDILDGAYLADGSYRASTNGVWVDGKRIQPQQWQLLLIDATIRLGNPKQPELLGFFIKLGTNETDHGASLSTVSFDAKEVWEATRRMVTAGCLLVRWVSQSKTAIVLAIDSQAESELGAQSGELVSDAGEFALESLIEADDRVQLQQAAELATKQDASVIGTYKVGERDVRIKFSRRFVNGEVLLLGFVEAVASPKKFPTITGDGGWPAVGAQVVERLSDDNPIWLVILAVLALAVVLIVSGL